MVLGVYLFSFMVSVGVFVFCVFCFCLFGVFIFGGFFGGEGGGHMFVYKHCSRSLNYMYKYFIYVLNTRILKKCNKKENGGIRHVKCLY